MLLDRVWLVLSGLGTYIILRSIYRVFFHPLRKIPGPKLVAVTNGVEFYYNIIRNGMYIFEIEKMHQRYGKRMPKLIRVTLIMLKSCS